VVISNRSLITVAGAALDCLLQAADIPAFRLTMLFRAIAPNEMFFDQYLN